MPFLDSLDIANSALQHVGAAPVLDINEDSRNNQAVAFAYDKLRRAELRRNVWRFAIRHAVLRPIDTTTLILSPSAWDATKMYLPGAIVSDGNGQLWISSAPDNINNAPGDTDVWDMYFGPMSVSLWDSGTTYFAGEIVYVLGATAGTYAVYLSLENANADVPGTADDWDSTATYYINDVVSYSGSMWRSRLQVNSGVTPADGPLAFDPTETYSSGQQVTGSDNLIYTSAVGANIGHDPTTDGGTHWTNTSTVNGWSRTPTVATSSKNWRVIDATVTSTKFTYPIGSGPSSQSSSRNVFRLPSGYLREAPQDPKAGSFSQLGAPSGEIYRDWDFEGDYIVSRDGSPFVFRFCADVTKVAAMDDMFCEGLACRIAVEICEPLTQSVTKLNTIASAYKQFMGEARTVNAIETGAVEPPEDDYLTCRA